MKRVNIHLSAVEIDRLERLSDSMGISKAEIIRRAVDEYMDHRDIPGVTGTLSIEGCVHG